MDRLPAYQYKVGKEINIKAYKSKKQNKPKTVKAQNHTNAHKNHTKGTQNIQKHTKASKSTK
jgi:hypothetical protein